MLNLANSNFEDWRKDNPDKNNYEFALTLEKLSSSNGPLFDFNKLNDISEKIIAKYSAKEVYKRTFNWAKKYDLKLAKIMEENPDYTKKILYIERSGEIKARKDIGKWSDVRREIEYFFDQNFSITKNDALHLLFGINPNDIKIIVDSFIRLYNEKDLKEEWFEKLKEISRAHGYAESTKTFKKNPEKYKGSVADVAKIFRVLLTGRIQTPDLYSIMQIMGKNRVLNRLLILQ